MSSSSSLEVYFSAAPDRAILNRPLLFHHTPKTAGTSFRFAVRHFMTEQGAGRMVMPAVRANLKASHHWTGGLADLYHMVAFENRIEAVTSHYTALLADVVADPILSIVREPMEHYASFLAFHSGFARQYIAGKGSPEELIRHAKFNNPQLRSFWMPHISLPIEQPKTRAEMDRIEDLVDRTLARFTLFTMADYPVLLDHCRRVYGAHLIEVREKRRPPDPANDDLLAMIEPHLRSHDPIWIDRLLYDRVLRLTATPVRETTSVPA